MKKFPIKEIAQICIIVPDVEKVARVFCDTFGVGPWQFYTYGKPLVKRMTRNGKPTEYKMRIALANIGPLRIELIEPIEGDTVYKEFVEQHGYGMHHLGILTDNMQESLKKAKEAGLSMTMDGAGFGPDNDGHYAYLDTEKMVYTTFELIERPKRRSAPEKSYPEKGSCSPDVQR